MMFHVKQLLTKAFFIFCKNAALLFILVSPLCGLAGEEALTVTFSEPAFSLGADGFVRIAVGGAESFGPVGKPVVPFVTKLVELPANARDISIESSATPVGGTLTATPVFMYQPVPAASSGAARRGGPDPAIYRRDAFYPASFAELATVQTRGGGLFAVIRVYPVRVNPMALQYEYAPEVAVRVSYSLPVAKAVVKRSLKAAPSAAAAAGDWRYLIITTNTLAAAFEPLAEYKRRNGTPTRIMNVADIYSQYTGRDAAEKVRNCIKDGYENHGTEYVLLGGYHAVVPVRKAYGNVDGDSGAILGSDLYYACLDGSWDGNRNNVFGEPHDGENGGDVDLAAEVAVGRAPAASVADVANFVAKTLYYTTNTHCNVSSALMLGEYLGSHVETKDGVIATFYPQGGNGLDDLADVLRAYDWTWLDDRPRHSHTWGESQVVSEINKMPNLVVHNGHGDASKSLFLTPWRIRNELTNTFPFFINSISCHAGKMTDANESVGEAMLNAPHAAVGVIMNSNYGWFDTEAEGMYSGEFVETFFGEAVVHGQPAGLAHQLSKQALLAKVERTGDMVYRWCYFENNLFGDPQLVLQRPENSIRVVPQTEPERFIIRNCSIAVKPFEFLVFNTFDTPAIWSVSSTSLLFTPSESLVYNGAAATNQISVAVSSAAGYLPPGTYTGDLVFSNWLASAAVEFKVSVTLIEAPTVTDISGTAVNALDFGTVTNWATKTHVMRIVNNDPSATLVIDRFSYGDDVTLRGIPDKAEFILYDFQLGFLDFFSTVWQDAPIVLYDCLHLDGKEASLGGIEVIPGDDYHVYAIDYQNAQFVAFDLSTGSYRCSPVDVDSRAGTLSGLAYSDYHRQMFAAYTFDQDYMSAGYGTTQFFCVNPGTGLFTPIGTVEGVIGGIAFSSDGTMYALELTDDLLLEVDPYTGEISRRLPLGVEIDISQGLDFDASGRRLYASLYLENEDACRLCVIDPATGSVHELQKLGGAGDYFELACLPSEDPFRVCPSVFPLTLPPGGSADLEIVCAPTSTGEFSELFGLYIRDSVAPAVSLPLSCNSIQPSRIDTPWLE